MLLRLAVVGFAVSTWTASSLADTFPYPCSYASYGAKFVSGNYKNPVHRGLDLMNKIGTPVYSVSDGTVHMYVASGGGLGGCPEDNKGEMIVVKYTKDQKVIYFAYLHVKNVPAALKSAGKAVRQADKIGEIADFDPCCSADGGSCPHLHFGVWLGPKDFPNSGWGRSASQLSWVDPEDYLSATHSSDPPTYSATYLSQNFTDPPADPSVSTRVQGDLTPIHCQVKFTVGENQTWTRQDVKLMVVNPDGTLRTDWSTFQFSKANLTHCA